MSKRNKVIVNETKTTFKQKLRSLRSPRDGNNVTLTEPYQQFYSRILEPDHRDYRLLLRKLASMDSGSIGVILLCEVLSFQIAPSFHNSSLYKEELAKVIRDRQSQVNADDFICSHFLHTNEEIISNVVETIILNTKRNYECDTLLKKIRNENWSSSTLYSIGELFKSRKKSYAIKSVLSRLKKYELLEKVDQKDIIICNTQYIHNEKKV